ncbi:MAG: hypothetical protein AAGF79_09280 [Pseudomonadota bacterium]
MSSSSTGRVTRRKVFYLPGYDPIAPRKYREIYRREAVEQARISGYDIALTAGPGGSGRYGWSVQACMDGAEVRSEIEVLVWSDIVKASLSRSVPAAYAQLLRTAWIYVTSGAFGPLMRLRKGPMIAAHYAVAMLVLYLLAAGLAGWAMGGVAARVLPPLGGGNVGLAWGIGLVSGWMVLRMARRADNRTFAFYLMHEFAYSAAGRGEIPHDLSDRLAQFSDRIAEALESEVDEVLLVGHSAGAHLGVILLADLLQSGRVRAQGPVLGFLSLGQVIPMISFLPRATRLRRALHELSQSDALSWVDVTAPGDGCAYALCDPVAVSGVASPGKRWPLIVSAAFSQTLSPDRWAALRWRFYRLHFQYLHAFDRPGDYDYFRLTAGPLTLGARYAGRAPSKSRVEATFSRHTSVAA